ncbi:hypothetical protein CANMA_003512 [Candida margitis]|uniref:uncharacterized protein n=1 Tax=Candida margitis TaxID=1775924 RepID=UPI0022272402|nr:uncharacterized protein CANMA_003512 [Candida margitis]KAI5965000.1 hypothetical protein CANMA_003512 [Candida margitis]
MLEMSPESLNAKRMMTGTASSIQLITSAPSGSPRQLPSRKRWREILRPSKSSSSKQVVQSKYNANHSSSYASPVSNSDETMESTTPFPPMSIQESLLTPPHICTPSFGSKTSSSLLEKVYSTPNTTPKSINFVETPSNKSSNSMGGFSYPHKMHSERLDSSFATILHNNVPRLNKRKNSQASSTKTTNSSKNSLENTCFICSELLSNILQSERVLKLNCGDSVHSECFRTAFGKELSSHRSNNEGSNTELPKPCYGSICKGERVITIDNRNLNSLMKRAYTALTPKRPAPTQPRAKENGVASESKSPKSQSINFKALRSTLNPHLQHFEPSRRSSARNRNTMVSSIRSPSPVNTISTTMTDSYNVNGFDNGQSTEIVVNQLMQYLLGNCATLNLAKLFHLGILRVADQLLVKVDDDALFREKYCYLFENSVMLWDKINDAVFVPVNNAKITCKGSIVLIVPTGGNVLQLSLQSHLSSVIEKWAIVLMDFSVEVPGCKVTNTIDLVSKAPEMSNKSVFGGFLGNKISPIIDSPRTSYKTDPNFPLGNFNSHSMISTDSLVEKELSLEKTKSAMSIDDDDDCDSDADSDEELIQRALKKVNTERINLRELHSLISEVDQML